MEGRIVLTLPYQFLRWDFCVRPWSVRAPFAPPLGISQLVITC